MSKSLTKSAVRLQKKLFATLARVDKTFKQARLEHIPKKSILFIIGCQRSGTTMMTRIFDEDLNAKVYGEFSKLSSGDKAEGLRLNPLDSVKRVIEGDRPPFIVLKPLVETQNALELLDYFENARALWMFRHYKDVASSNLKRFGMDNGIKDLRPIVAAEGDNWRSEGVSPEVREVVAKHFSESMNPYDAAALFWFARNSLFFEQNLSEHPEVMMCKYEDLVLEPKRIIKQIYAFARQPFPGEDILAQSHRESLGKGKNIALSPAVEGLCEAMWQRLNAAYTAPAARSGVST